ncbi:Zinc finger BED domain-containing protein RICESLEEPER 3, partial [Bienertia sinuspersici]
SEVLKRYRFEKLSVKEILSVIPSRIAFTFDSWSCNYYYWNIGYISLTTYYIDSSWRAHFYVTYMNLIVQDGLKELMRLLLRYWYEFSTIMDIATILNPRYKLKTME